MAVIYIILGVIGLCLILEIVAMIFHKPELGSAAAIVLLIAFLAFVVSACCLAVKEQNTIEQNTPTAMDVYRGDTTLEITYRDGVPVDTVVVFKQKVYGE